jgi:hypothetical protein
MRKVVRSDNTQTDKTIERRETIRQGDTISIKIPNIIYKDTTIFRTNYETKTKIRIRYDEDGNAEADCISAEIEEKLELIRETIKNDIKNNRDSSREFNPQYFIYALAFLGVVLIVLILLILRIQNQTPKIVAGLLKGIKKE